VNVAAPQHVKGPAGAPDDLIWRMSIDHYHAMVSAGILTDDDPVELLEGWLVVKFSKTPPHTYATQRTRELLEEILPDGWHIGSHDPVTTGDSEPEPDASVIRGECRDYTTRHPGPGDVALVVEVADLTLRRDQRIKRRVYARAAVPVYWVVNLVDRQVEVYTGPTGPADEPDYTQRRDYRPGEQVPVVVDGREVGRLNVSDLLP
jgi:Uma2 family endonuclease